MREDPEVSEQQVIRAHVEADVHQAVHALANAAATADAGGDASEHLWFLVRALCYEHSMDLAVVMARAENVAASRVERAQQQ
jgi:hypothetical protein